MIVTREAGAILDGACVCVVRVLCFAFYKQMTTAKRLWKTFPKIFKRYIDNLNNMRYNIIGGLNNKP